MHSSKLALATLFALVSSAANAVTLDFSGIVFGAYFGNANIAPVAGGACPGTGTLGCYSEDGFILGALADSSNLTAHFHRAGPAADRRISYHSDAAGIYLRKQDGSAFSLSSFDFLAAISDSNPDSGPSDFWEIRGFNTAVNPTLDTDTSFPSQIAYQTVANGFSGSLNLLPSFNNVNAVWVVFNGYRQTPVDGKEFQAEFDNFALGDPVAPVNVPVPALGMWGLAALCSGVGVRRTGRSLSA
jgi:hypothetical protein